MTAALDGAVELLDRSLAYTRGALSQVRPELLERSTPCARWTLRDLLGHMEDALDAFTEAAAGRVEVGPLPPVHDRVEALREKACLLLGAWASAAAGARAPGPVRVGGVGLDAPVLVATAALEITLHGWDVGQATGARARIPADLARGLLGVAEAVIDDVDRGARFATPRPLSPRAPYDERLLAWAGRSSADQLTGPAAGNRCDPRTGQGLAS